MHAEFTSDGRLIAASLERWASFHFGTCSQEAKLRDLTSRRSAAFTPPTIKPGQMPNDAEHGRHRGDDDQHDRHDVGRNDGPEQ